MKGYLCIGGPLDGARIAARGNILHAMMPPSVGAEIDASQRYDVGALPVHVAEYRLRTDSESEPVWQFYKTIVG